MNKKSVYLSFGSFLVLLFLVFFASSYFRYHQYQVWREYPRVYFVDKYPAMTTLDAYYWLRYAKEYKEGVYYKDGIDHLMAYPTGTHKPDPVPMISFIIAWLSKITGQSIYMSGLMIIPLFASLFIIPLALYGWEIGAPVAGLAGGAVGAFAWMYAIRTAMGRVDTDLLQLFFLFAGSFFLFKTVYADDERKRYLYAILLGLNFLLFGWWYAHVGVDFIYLVIFLFMLIATRRVNFKQSLMSLFLFVVFANPVWVAHSFVGVYDFIHSYGKIKSVSGGNFPNILLTVTEAEHISATKVMGYILHHKAVDTFGLLFAFAFFVWGRLKTVPLLPVFLLGLLSFRSANRLVMFLAPFVGIGWGFVLDFILKVFFEYVVKFNEALRNIVSFLTSLGLIVILLSFSAYKLVLPPSIAAPIVDSFVQIKHKFHKGVIFSWWDYGYAIEDIAGFATYHDGGAHGGARTYLVAKALISDNQTLMYHIISFMDAYGVKPIVNEIKDNVSTSKAVKMAFNYSRRIRDKDNYVLFTQDMVGKYYAISFLGSWNFKDNRSFPDGFGIDRCYSYQNGVFKCNLGNIDLVHGVVGNDKIENAVWVVNGSVAKIKRFNNKGINVEICFVKLPGGRLDFVFALLCDKRVFDSNFNKMFILGEYDKNLYEEVYNNFPFARMYRVK